jgi:DNA-binding Lrp family transcriptional regulator
MKFTERDKKLLRTLSDFGLLSTKQIQRLVFPKIRKTTMLRRLRLLEKRNLIRRIKGLNDGNLCWCLTTVGASSLGIEYPLRHINKNSLEHDITLNEVRLSLKTVSLGENWTSEHVLRAKTWKYKKSNSLEQNIIPDGIFTSKARTGYHAIAVELELSRKSKSRYRKILQSYHKKQHIGLLWYLVSNKNLGKLLEQEWNKIDKTNSGFYWSEVHQVLNDPWNIQIHNKKDSRNLRDLIDMTEPAHLPAQAMSNLNIQIQP